MNPVLNSHLRLLEYAGTMCTCTRVLFASFVIVLYCESEGAVQMHVHLHVLVVGASVRAGIYCMSIAAHVQVCISWFFESYELRVTSFFCFVFIYIYFFFFFLPLTGVLV